MKKYGPPAYDPQGALTFLKEDLARHVGDSGRPVVLSSHCGFDTDRWHTNDWQAAYEVMRPYNVVLYAYGHTGTGLRDWAPPAERTLRCVNTGQTENGFFIVQITDDRVRLAFRAKQWQQEPAPEGKTRKTWNGQWTWLHQSMMLAPAGLISQRATKAVTAREG
jgi:cytolysin (calcineurin-like family phosphatase)